MGCLAQVASIAKEIVNRAVDREKALDLSQRREPSHMVFALSGGLVRDLSPVVSVLPGVVSHGRHGSPMSGPIAAQVISDQPIGNVARSPFNNLRKNRVAAPIFRRFCTRISSVSPS